MRLDEGGCDLHASGEEGAVPGGGEADRPHLPHYRHLSRILENQLPQSLDKKLCYTHPTSHCPPQTILGKQGALQNFLGEILGMSF